MSPTTSLFAHGITVDLPPLWEGRIALRQPVQPAYLTSLQAAGASDSSGGLAAHGETFYPVTHLANFALPTERGDFGSGAVDLMGPTHCFIALLEFGPESVGTALFAAASNIPLPQSSDFGPNSLQHRIPGQLGYQRFFSVNGRAFCVFVVLGGQQYLQPLTSTARGVLQSTSIGAR